MMGKQKYEAEVFYECEAISILDRNIQRIAGDFNWHSAEIPTNDRGARKFNYFFGTNRARQRFIKAMRRFVTASDFGVRVHVKEVG